MIICVIDNDIIIIITILLNGISTRFLLSFVFYSDAFCASACFRLTQSRNMLYVRANIEIRKALDFIILLNLERWMNKSPGLFMRVGVCVCVVVLWCDTHTYIFIFNVLIHIFFYWWRLQRRQNNNNHNNNFYK